MKHGNIETWLRRANGLTENPKSRVANQTIKQPEIATGTKSATTTEYRR